MTAHKTEDPALPLLIPDLIPGDGSININLQNSNIEAFVSMSIHEKKTKQTSICEVYLPISTLYPDFVFVLFPNSSYHACPHWGLAGRLKKGSVSAAVTPGSPKRPPAGPL